MKGFALKKVRPVVPQSVERKYESRLATVGINADTRAKLTALRSEGIVEADIVREALRQYLSQFFEETEA